MASSVNSDLPEEEVERFDDFTLASSWERFISEIEGICRQWLSNGSKVLSEKGAVQSDVSEKLFKVKCDLKYAAKSYCMEYYFETRDKVEEWDTCLHDLQLCFGVKDFLVISPQSANGVVLDTPEASKLLSAVAIAMTNSGSLWPAFVPVHDPSRKAYIGIQNSGTVYTRRFEADHISSQVPVKYMHLEGLYELFVSKFVYNSSDLAFHHPKVLFTMNSTYRTSLNEDDDPMLDDAEYEDSENSDGKMRHRTHWDDDCPWSEWYSAEDPLKGFELVSTWLEKTVLSSLEMAELENSSPHEAELWALLPLLSQNFFDGSRICFSSQLLLLVDTLLISFDAQFMEDFVSAENPTPDNVRPNMVMPSPAVLDRILKDLFQGAPGSEKGEQRNFKSIKGAPFGSLFARFCLHCLWIGNCNIRAISVLWIEFIREVRWCWEESQPLPKISTTASLDLSTCLINQKLQMLAICIERRSEMNEEFEDCIGSIDSPLSKENSDEAEEKDEDEDEVAVVKEMESMRRGSKGEIGSMMLLKSKQLMHAPYTQDPPLMTEDAHEERLQAVAASDDSFGFSAQLEKDILLSDMSAFKAANPDAVFEDFIRWHSPGDWESDAAAGNEWPPRGRLSKRMSETGNLWRKLWDDVPAVPASEQKPLLDPISEGEKILHYLETLRPNDLLEQILCTAFKASADTLNLTNYGDLKQMKGKIEQLFATIGSSLRDLQGNWSPSDDENVEDLRRLCAAFQHVEELVAVAASLHRKFKQAPRLSEEFFAEFFSAYVGRMGIGSKEKDSWEKAFGKRKAVGMKERQCVGSLFSPPSARQSWRKALSMGNLLNGHEPLLREIRLCLRESFSNNYYFSGRPEDQTETFRMYICGSSNDLRVALSVASCD